MKKGAQFVNSASNIVDYFTNLFGLKKKTHKLTGWDDWDVVEEDDPIPTPASNPDERV